jgi:negative regulator of replication initiation
MLKISGKKRKYFALSSKELEEKGSSVSPKQIPGSPVDRGKPSGVFL